jgi:DNA-binding XRE family transcriptional regulator
MKKLGNKIEREKYNELIKDDICINLIRVLFEIVYILKFIDQQNILLENDTQDLLSNNRIELAQYYTMLLTKTANSSITNHIIFTIGYIIHIGYFKAFLNDRNQFKIRFVLDCYHILIFEINGIYVSDYYLQVMIEKIFTKNFFIYE